MGQFLRNMRRTIKEIQAGGQDKEFQAGGQDKEFQAGGQAGETFSPNLHGSLKAGDIHSPSTFYIRDTVREHVVTGRQRLKRLPGLLDGPRVDENFRASDVVGDESPWRLSPCVARSRVSRTPENPCGAKNDMVCLIRCGVP